MAVETKWTNTLLDEKRKHGDPAADKAAAALFEAIKGRSPAEVGEFMRAFVSHDFSKAWQGQTLIPDPPELIEYFENFDDFRFTAEEVDALEKGSLIFQQHGPMITFTLGVRSLLKQYAHTKAIEVLRLTTLLVRHVNRRIMETMQFVLDVMSPNWVIKNPDGTHKLNLQHPGLLSIKKLRLVHAMIRYRIKHKLYDVSLGPYDEDHFGYPINQEDMVFAIHTFSLEIIEGLREMRTKISDQEAEDYFQCWKIIGRGLGIDRDLEPASYEDGVVLQEMIYKRHFTTPNESGPILATALMNWFVETVPLLDIKTLTTFIRDFNGPENYAILSDNLKIDIGNTHVDLEEHIRNDQEFQITLRFGPEPKPGEETEGKKISIGDFFLHFIRILINTERGGKNETFRVGDGFISSWNLNRISEKPLSKIEVIMLMLTQLWQKIKSLFKRSPSKAPQPK